MKEDKYISIIFVINKNIDEIDKDKIISLSKHLFETFTNVETIIVNNDSEYTLDSLKNEINNLSIVNLSYKHSLQRAVTAGIDIAIGDFTIEVYDYEGFEINHIELMYNSSKTNDFVFLSHKINRFTYKIVNYLVTTQYKQLKKEKIKESIAIWSSRRGHNKISAQGNIVVNRDLAYILSGLSYTYHYISIKKHALSRKDNLHLILDSTIFYTNIISRISIYFAFLLVPIGIFISLYFSMSLDNIIFFSTILIIAQVLLFLFAITFKYLHHILYSSVGYKNYSFRNVDRK